VAELPFILMHPKPDDIDENLLIIEQKSPNNNEINIKPLNNVGEKQLQQSSDSPTTKDEEGPNLIQLDG
jgi:hypothetical protein